MAKFSVGTLKPMNVLVEAANAKEALEKALNGEGELVDADMDNEFRNLVPIVNLETQAFTELLSGL